MEETVVRVWKQRLIVPGLVVVLVSPVFAPRPGPDQVTPQNYARTCDGMTREEVETILGPPGDYRTGPTEQNEGVTIQAAWAWMRYPRAEIWESDSGACFVAFSPTGRMEVSQFLVRKKVQQGPLADLLWRAKRQWHRWFP
jgi:hypothetical protein